jgi:hypothetical protein
VARPLVWLALGLVMLLWGTTESDARLQPYFVLRTATTDTTLRPRILFVLDTSGSMGNQAKLGLTECGWNECENPASYGTIQESRIGVARRVIRETIVATDAQAKFALMTFDQNEGFKPTVLPAKCTDGGINQRFVWIDTFWYTNAPQPLNRHAGHVGAWKLCMGRQIRPYAYLRWDELGVGSVITANNETDALPPSPLISTAAADITQLANANRKVQWFPRFMGVRFHPDDTTDPGHVLTYASNGDYGTTNVNKDANVWGHDFYYWPYVDGFPGYANFRVTPYDSSGTDPNLAGIAASQSSVFNAGKLFAPFYLDLSDTAVVVDANTPDTEDEAKSIVVSNVSSITEGGVDAAGETPWASTIGDIPALPIQSNSVYSHETVSSYLAFVNSIDSPDYCAPTTAVLITDGNPSPVAEGGSLLYQRLSALRRQLDTKVYVVGFFLNSNDVNNMACAGAGACDGGLCDTPCDDTPADGWDTCANPANPTGQCAYLSNTALELQTALTQIVKAVTDFDLPSGPGSTANEFGVDKGDGSTLEALQTSIEATTEFPSWKGHVIRSYCDFRDPDTDELLPACTPPSPEFPATATEETFGPCPQSRSWDAGECLALTPWTERRLYTHDANNELVLVADPDGSASAGFVAELTAQGLVSGAQAQEEADELAAFVLGRDAPDGWKLPGLANSAPILVQRIGPYDASRIPSVAIRDPHCGGRLLGASDGVPSSLEDYAKDVWDEANLLQSPSTHFESQEAVLLGDDFGVLHAFQLDSGNELWALLPRFMLASLVQKAALGAASYGQPAAIEEHLYGLAGTINRGFVFDDRDADPALHRWRQLAIMGMGAGGTEHLVLDVSHMSPSSPQGPFEILWTTEDAALKASYDPYSGQTWSRPAMGYHVPGEVSTQEPDAFFVMGTGYASQGGAAEQGRVLLRSDALSGQLLEYAVMPAVDPSDTFEPAFGTVTDVAVATHCLSRMWAEMQEVYIADPAGRLFRWDLGRETNHEADSGGPWGTTATSALSEPIPACEGTGDTCTVDPGNRAESFTFPPAVTSNDRLDDVTSVSSAGPTTPTNQFLLALVGGSPSDDALREGPGANYQSSLYILVDDHAADKPGGITVPAGAPKTAPGVNPSFMRVALTDIERTRTLVPFTGATPIQETRNFSRGTRPLRAPRIFVTGVVDESTVDTENPTVLEGVEVYNLQFTVYEPPTAVCDPSFYDDTDDQWHEDPGSTFLLTYRLTANVANGFDLINGAGAGGGAGGSGAGFGAGFATGLTLASVEQIGSGECESGGCGPQLANPASAPCDNNATSSGGSSGAGAALAVTHTELTAFTPVE